jgi:hypothetical protein
MEPKTEHGKQLISEAKKRVESYIAIDREAAQKHGPASKIEGLRYGAPEDQGPVEQVATGVAALAAGIDEQNWGLVAEAFLLFQQAHRELIK